MKRKLIGLFLICLLAFGVKVFADGFDSGGIATGSSGSSAVGGGWTDDGTTVRLTSSSDKVGIGTTAPASALDVRGKVTTSNINSTIIVDGVTYAANSTGIQAALVACSAQGGGIVFLPPGTYSRTAQINIPSKCWLQGAGMGATIIQTAAGSIAPTDADNTAAVLAAGPSAGTFYSNGTRGVNIHISDLTVDGNYTAFPTWDAGNHWQPFPAGINILFVDGLRIERVEVKNTFNDGIMDHWNRNTIIRDCWIHKIGQSAITSSKNGISFQGGEYGDLNTNHLAEGNIITDTLNEGIVCSNCLNTDMVANDIYGFSEYGIEITDSDGTDRVMYGVNLLGNKIHDITGAQTSKGINWAPDSNSTVGCSIVGNSMYNIGHNGMYISKFNYGLVADNVLDNIHNGGEGGIYAVSMDFLTNSHTTVSNNIVTHYVANPYNEAIRLYASDHCLVKGNQLYGFGLYGIDIGTTSTYNSVQDNYLDAHSNPSTYGILSGTNDINNIVKNNRIINTTNRYSLSSGNFLIESDIIGGVNTFSVAGNVGIGSTTPSKTLDVVGTLGVSGHDTLEGVTSTGATGTGKFVFNTTPTLVTPVLGAATGTSLAVTGNITSSAGNVGIGTSSPQKIFEIAAGGAFGLIRNSLNSSYGGFRFENDQNSGSRSLDVTYTGSTYVGPYFTNGVTGEIGAIGTSGNYSLQFGTNSTARMLIEDDGDVAIGTTVAPSTRLRVVGAGTTTAKTFAALNSNIVENFTILDSGNVGIGTTAPARLLSLRGGNLSIAGTAPTLSSCGGSPSVVGSDNNFEITVGSAATGCTATFATAKTNAPVCNVTNQSASLTSALGYTISTTAITISQATGLSSDLIDVICIPRD